MDVPTPYLINDTRKIDFFKKTTFSNYLKKDVIQTLFKKIDEGKLGEVCHWLTECISSGYLHELWEKSIDYYTKFINVNSPFIPYHLYWKLVFFIRLEKQEHFKKHFLDLRNSQEVRNHFCELFCILTQATKMRKSFVIPKISGQDFQTDLFQKKLKAPCKNFSQEMLDKSDPPELGVVINEFTYYLQSDSYHLRDCCYWLFWILEWEKLMILKIGRYEGSDRHLEGGVDKKYGRDCIWLFWFVILREMSLRRNKLLSNQIKSLFEFFKFKFTASKKKRRVYLMINSIQLLDPTLELDPEKYPIFEKYYLTVQACANINILFRDLKKEENQSNDYVNSKIKQEATMVITKHEDVTQLQNISLYRQQLKEKKQLEKDYRRIQEQKKKKKIRNKEEREIRRKTMLEQIDNHIINNSHLRPIPINSSTLQQKIESEKKKSLTGNYQKTVNLIESIDKKLKLNEENKKQNKEKLKTWNVIKTD